MRNFAIVVLALLLGACGQITFSLPPYQPVTTDELKGAVAVADFNYRPKEGVRPNEIRETAAGTILMTENVSIYYSNAVRRELRQAGLSLLGDKCTVTGTVYDFAIDSLGFSSTYITDVEYRLVSASGDSMSTSRHQIKFTTTKFLAAPLVLANLQKAVSDNILKFLGDPDFRAAQARCR